MKTTIPFFGTLAILAFALGACSNNDDGNTPDDGRTHGNYIVAVSPIAAEGVADYLLNTASLDAGTITTEKNGTEQDGTYRYYVTHKGKFFSMLYGQGNPGAVTVYDLQNGLLNKLTNFQTETVQAFTPVNDDILMVKMARDLKTEISRWYRVNADQMLIVGQGEINTKSALVDNGEWAQFSWIKQVGDKVFAPFFCIKDNNWYTDDPDKAWIAVYSYPDMQLEKVIKDNRTSFIGNYFVDGLAVDEQGDTYAFSPSMAVKDDKITSTKPSAITRIKAGSTAFDDYYFNVEAAAEGYSITNWNYAGNGKAVGLFIAPGDKQQYASGKRIGAIDLYSKTIRWVSGVPEASEINYIAENNYSLKDGKTVYMGITLKDGSSYVYKIDAVSGSATQGLKVNGGLVTAISHLD